MVGELLIVDGESGLLKVCIHHRFFYFKCSKFVGIKKYISKKQGAFVKILIVLFAGLIANSSVLLHKKMMSDVKFSGRSELDVTAEKDLKYANQSIQRVSLARCVSSVCNPDGLVVKTDDNGFMEYVPVSNNYFINTQRDFEYHVARFLKHEGN